MSRDYHKIIRLALRISFIYDGFFTLRALVKKLKNLYAYSEISGKSSCKSGAKLYIIFALIITIKIFLYNTRKYYKYTHTFKYFTFSINFKTHFCKFFQYFTNSWPLFGFLIPTIFIKFFI